LTEPLKLVDSAPPKVVEVWREEKARKAGAKWVVGKEGILSVLGEVLHERGGGWDTSAYKERDKKQSRRREK
jgi:hypothetical protein